MSVSMLLGESGRVGNRHFEMKGLRNESLFSYSSAGCPEPRIKNDRSPYENLNRHLVLAYARLRRFC